MTEVTPSAFDGHRALHSPRISFEFFPPKTEEMERSLWETVNRLAPLTPNFVSVTYGAGGSTRERTHSTIALTLKETRLTPAAHLTRVRARGIDIPVVPGIMPMHNFKQARNFVTRAGTTVPTWLADKFEGLDDDAETRKLVAATVAAGQVQKLAKHGVDTFHFYTMNRADLVFAISHLLGIRPKGAQKAA